MSGSKAISLIAGTLFVAGLASAQSLAEIAQKEKERREALKGKTSQVVTNADLAKVKKKASYAVPAPVVAEEAAGEAAAAPGAAGAATGAAPELANQGPPAAQAPGAVEDAGQTRAQLQDRWNKAKERVDLLNLKMQALYQQYYSFNSMVRKDTIQQEIADNAKLIQEAQAEAAKAKKELDGLGGPAKK